MYRLLRLLFTGKWHLCNHEWETIKKGRISTRGGKQIGNFYDCRCKFCGSYKVFNLK